jgi:pyochelin synthetase
LRKHLPDYMTPSAVLWHDSLPLTRNGKVDRVKLATIPTPDTISTPDSAPDTELERRVAEIWAGILKVAGAGVTSTFFELGGDSLAAARLLTTVRKEFGVAITLDRLPEVDTVRRMAAEIGRSIRS